MLPKHRPTFRPGFDSLDGRILLSVSRWSRPDRQAYSENLQLQRQRPVVHGHRAGETIAIVIGGLENPIYNDLTKFDQTFGLAAPPSFKAVDLQRVRRTQGGRPPSRRRWTWSGRTRWRPAPTSSWSRLRRTTPAPT